MSEIEERTSAAIAELRREWSPPGGVEDRMLADFHARIGGPPDGGGDPGELPGGDGGVASGGGSWLYAAKIVLAIGGLTATGVGGVALVAKLARDPDRDAAPRVERSPVVEVDAPPGPPMPEEQPVSVVVEPSLPESPPPSVASESKPPVRVASRKPTSVDLAAELALIRRARAAKPEQALELRADHARSFPAGALSSEREALRAAALCELDRLDEARRTIDRFLADDPGPAE